MKKTAKIKLLVIGLFIIFSIMFFTGNVYAKGTINPDDYAPGSLTQGDVEPIIGIANPIVGTIRVAGIVIAVITLIIMGIKYMLGSVEEKAEYKKKMIPYIIGVFLLVAITQLLGVVIELISGMQ